MFKKEGHIQFQNFKTFYKIFGKPTTNKVPLLVLHGGPGSGHNYLLPLAELAEKGQQIVFYDQLGCGESSASEDRHDWSINLFIAELNELRIQLGLEKINLLGHSWGGMLAIEYILSKPSGINKLVLSSSMISIPLYQREVDKLKQKLPNFTGSILEKHEKAGSTDSREYEEAYDVYMKHHLFRGEEFPKEYTNSNRAKGQSVYKKMWGASEAFADGDLKNWNRIDDLAEIDTPTLIVSGQYDELTPWQAALTRDKIPNSQLKIFTNASHLAPVEVKDEYLSVIREFLG